MNRFIFFLSFCFTCLGYAQQLKFKIIGVPDTTIHLVKYVGSSMYYADTAEIRKGMVVFDGSKQEQGIMGVLLPGQKYFEFLHTGEEVHMQTKFPNFIPDMEVIKSNQNRIFIDYIRFLTKNSEEAKKLTEEMKELADSEDAKKKKIEAELKIVNENVKEYQQRLITDNKGSFVSKLILMSTDIQIPDAPKNEDGTYVEKDFGYKYMRDHFFDNIDLTDDRLVNTPVIQKKLEYYYSNQMLIQHPDTLIKYLIRVVDQIPSGTMMYRFFVTKITSNFEKSKIMGMDKVMNAFVWRYYCPIDSEGKRLGYWMEEEKLEELCNDTKKRLRLVQGEVPPNIILPDSTNQNWRDLYSLDNEYIVLYFWDPNCGHCKKETPKLQTLYSRKLKDRNIEVFAVGKATGDDFEDWKKFIRKNRLTFINVGLTDKIYKQAKANPTSLIPSKTTLESLNYQDTYDIFSTPKVWILDKDKKIVAKGLGISQIEDFLDRVQGLESEEKIFKPEDDKEDSE